MKIPKGLRRLDLRFQRVANGETIFIGLKVGWFTADQSDAKDIIKLAREGTFWPYDRDFTGE